MATSTTPSASAAYSWKTQTNGAVQTYTRDIDKANESIQAAYDQGETAFGFDVEWKPSFRKGEAEHPVALVQLATNNRILLIQISAMSAVPEKLVALLTDPNIVKAGVGIQGDIKKIHKDLNICTRSCVDLSLLARTVDNARWKGPYKNPIGLARLTEVYENKALGKGLITRSNWELDLSPEQIEYASNDAHAGFALYTRLSALLSPDNPGHKRKYYSFDLIRGRLYEPSSGDSAVKEWRCHNPEYDPGPPPEPRQRTDEPGIPAGATSKGKWPLNSSTSGSGPNDTALSSSRSQNRHHRPARRYRPNPDQRGPAQPQTDPNFNNNLSRSFSGASDPAFGTSSADRNETGRHRGSQRTGRGRHDKRAAKRMADQI